MRQDKDGTIKVLEVNANPDVTPELGIARQAAAVGISYSQLIQKIIDLALERQWQSKSGASRQRMKPSHPGDSKKKQKPSSPKKWP